MNARTRAVALGVAVALVAALSDVPRPAGPVAAAPAPAQTCPESLPDEGSALLTARWCGGRVEIANHTTETARAWALPSGQIETQIHAGVMRFRDSRNRWVDVDLAMERKADGSVGPRAHPNRLTVSGPPAGARTI